MPQSPRIIVPRIIVLLGPQGSGKGTQAALLRDHVGFPVITMSALLRQEIATGSERGQKIKALIDVGKLAPQEITNELLAKRLGAPDAQKGAVIDGYPRDLVQYQAFDTFANPTEVILLDIADGIAVQRIAGRRVCQCGRIYHLEFNPPKNDEVCDACGAKLELRVDDYPEAIRERLAIYHRETEPVVNAYRERGILHTIDASGPIHLVHEDILKALGV